MNRLLMIASALAALVVSGRLATPTACGQAMVLRLKPEAWVSEPMAYVGDVAQVEWIQASTTQAARITDQVRRLDLKLLNNDNDPVTITAENVRTRILVNGLRPGEFVVEGARQCTIHRAQAPVFQKMVQACVIKHVSAGLNVGEQNIQAMIEFDSKNLQELLTVWSSDCQLRSLDNVDQMMGRRTIEVGVFREDRLLASFRLASQVSVFMNVAIANQPLVAGTTLDESQIYTEQRRIDSSTLARQIPSTVLGQVAARPIRAQQIIQLNDITSPGAARLPARKQAEPDLVSNRDLVNVTLERGGLKVTLSGAQAMQSGKRGDLIPVKNTATGKTIMARVVAAGEVQLAY